MKLLFILENYIPNVGGVETLFKNLTQSLVEQGHNVTILTHQLRGTKKFESINSVKVYRISCFYSRYWFTFFSIPMAIILGRNADIIHTTTYNASLPARISARINKKRSIITVHEILGKNWGNFGINIISVKIHEFLEYLITKFRFDIFVSVSESTKKQLIMAGVSENKVRVVYNGVDYSYFEPKKYNKKEIRERLSMPKDFVYTFYGRPGISKGLEYLLRAVPFIDKEIPNSKLVLILSKSPKNMYRHTKQLIKELEIGDKSILLEPVSYEKLPEYIFASDCVVVPSLTEGFGYAVAESCALGIPLVATNTTSIPEVISGKYVLVEPSNPKAIAEGVIKVYNKNYNVTRLKRFTIAENTKNYLKIYKSLAHLRS